MKNKTIIVDLDSTLWDFHKAMCDLQKSRFGSNYYDHTDFVEWDSWNLFLTEKEFCGLYHEIHMNQHRYKPFKEAENFLKELKNSGFYVIIASHRDNDSKKATKMFLRNHNLVYNKLHLSQDKTVLFNKAGYIVDDCPRTLEKALDEGLKCFSLKYDWNKHLEDKVFLTDNLNKILDQMKINNNIYMEGRV